MAIFARTVEHTIPLAQTLERGAMALNFSFESELNLEHQGGRTHTESVEDTLSLEQEMYRTHLESVTSTLSMSDSASAINAGREIRHELILESEVTRAPSIFHQRIEDTLTLGSFVSVKKLPFIEGQHDTGTGFSVSD